MFLGGHQSGQQIAVTGHEHHVGAGAISGQLGELGVHRRVDTLLRPPPVTAGERPQPNGHPRHDAQSAVLGLGYTVGSAVEPVDAEQRLFRVGLGPLAQALDQGRVVNGDTGTGGLSGQQTRGCAQQIAGVHQDDATVHALHPLPGIRERIGGPGRGGCGSVSSGFAYSGFPSSLPDRGRVKVRNSIIGVADPGNGA